MLARVFITLLLILIGITTYTQTHYSTLYQHYQTYFSKNVEKPHATVFKKLS